LQGIAEGEKQKAIKIAKNILKERLSIELIIKLTGLTKAVIERLNF
jgi:hypothetical protein